MSVVTFQQFPQGVVALAVKLEVFDLATTFIVLANQYQTPGGEGSMLSGKYECFSCGEVFEDQQALQRHEREHSRKKLTQ